jgi:CheY-like chemotaxis protein
VVPRFGGVNPERPDVLNSLGPEADATRGKGSYDLGRAMTSTATRPPLVRSGAVAVLSAGQGRDPDDLRVEGLDARPSGYQAPMTSGQGVRPPQADAPRVLLVDDAPAIRNALRGVLEDAGVEVVGEAPDGIEGVALAGSLRPDVVLMDLRMPASDGFEATARIVERYPGVRVVVLSAYETEESAAAVRTAGAFAFLPKHCDTDRIRATVFAAWRS